MKIWSKFTVDVWVHSGSSGWVRKIVIEDDGRLFADFYAHSQTGRLLGKRPSLRGAQLLVEDQMEDDE